MGNLSLLIGVMTALVHLAAGLGNIVLATPLLQALDELGYTIDLCLNADYSATASLFEDWCVVRAILDRFPSGGVYNAIIPAVPPFYWPRFRAMYRRIKTVSRPPDDLFCTNEQGWYLGFANALGYPRDRAPQTYLPIPPNPALGATATTVILAPGCKTGQMSAKRWSGFAALAERFEEVAIVGSPDDLFTKDGLPLKFGAHVKNFVGRLSLRETAQCLASAGLVIANDSGVGHLAAAVGAPTLLLFGPTPHLTLGPMPSHVTVLRSNLLCQACWSIDRFKACKGAVNCLQDLSVDDVERTARQLIHAVPL